MNKIELSIVVPCYNEEKNISEFFKVLVRELSLIKDKYELIFVNDGSNDQTYNEMIKLRKNNKFINIINFSKNFGKESAMLAGLKKSIGKYTVIIDSDLQQNPKYILEMKKILDNNQDIDEVACVQKNRKENKIVCFLKNKFYKIIRNQTNLDFVSAASDFRMFRKSVKEAIISLTEKNRFSKGLFAYVGYNIYYLPYEVEERYSGKSKWNIIKLFKYAFNGITDFSLKPISYLFIFSILILFLSIIFIIISLLKNYEILLLFSIFLFIISIFFILQSISNFYIGKIFIEVKNRPQFFIKGDKYEKD